MKLYIFRTFPLSIIRSLFTVHSAMVYVIQLSSRTRMELQFHPGPARKLSKNLYDIHTHTYIYTYTYIYISYMHTYICLHTCMTYIYIYMCHSYVHTYICQTTFEQYHPGPARKLSTNLYDVYHC